MPCFPWCVVFTSICFFFFARGQAGKRLDGFNAACFVCACTHREALSGAFTFAAAALLAFFSNTPRLALLFSLDFFTHTRAYAILPLPLSPRTGRTLIIRLVHAVRGAKRWRVPFGQAPPLLLDSQPKPLASPSLLRSVLLSIKTCTPTPLFLRLVTLCLHTLPFDQLLLGLDCPPVVKEPGREMRMCPVPALLSLHHILPLLLSHPSHERLVHMQSNAVQAVPVLKFVGALDRPFFCCSTQPQPQAQAPSPCCPPPASLHPTSVQTSTPRSLLPAPRHRPSMPPYLSNP